MASEEKPKFLKGLEDKLLNSIEEMDERNISQSLDAKFLTNKSPLVIKITKNIFNLISDEGNVEVEFHVILKLLRKVVEIGGVRLSSEERKKFVNLMKNSLKQNEISFKKYERFIFHIMNSNYFNSS